MIVELEQYTQKLASLRAQLKEVSEGLHIDDMERELSELKEEMNADGFWDNLERSTYVNRRISNLEGKIKHYEGLLSGCDDVETMMELAQEENDEDMIAEAGSEIEKLRETCQKMLAAYICVPEIFCNLNGRIKGTVCFFGKACEFIHIYTSVIKNGDATCVNIPLIFS